MELCETVTLRVAITPNVWLFRWLIDAIARRILMERCGADGNALLDEIWSDAAERWLRLPAQSTIGATLTVRLAAVTAAAYATLLARRVPPEEATQTVYSIAWSVYEKMGGAAWSVSGVISRDPARRLRIATLAFRAFPFSAPSYEWQAVSSPSRTVAFNCLRCPVAEYFKAEELSELCVQTWCALDFPLAERVWNSQLERSGSIAGGAAVCDFRWYAIESEQPKSQVAHIPASLRVE